MGDLVFLNFVFVFVLRFDGGVIPELHDRVRDMLSTLQPSAAAFGGFGASANPVCWVGTELGNTPTHIWAQGSAEGPGDPTSPDYCPKGCDTTLQVLPQLCVSVCD